MTTFAEHPVFEQLNETPVDQYAAELVPAPSMMEMEDMDGRTVFGPETAKAAERRVWMGEGLGDKRNGQTQADLGRAAITRR